MQGAGTRPFRIIKTDKFCTQDDATARKNELSPHNCKGPFY